MVYNGKPYKNGWFGGTTIFGNIHMVNKKLTPLRKKNTSSQPHESFRYINHLEKFLAKIQQFRPEGLPRSWGRKEMFFLQRIHVLENLLQIFLLRKFWLMISTSLCKHCNLHLIHSRNQSTNHFLKTTAPKHESKYELFNWGTERYDTVWCDKRPQCHCRKP